jgi:hypothetical protein
MTITFEHECDIIVYALEKIISFAKENQYIFVAQCVWWLASIIGLEKGLVIHIDNLRKRERIIPLKEGSGLVHSDRAQQIQSEREISSTPRDLTEDLRLNRVLEEAEKCITSSQHIRQHNRINPLPQTKNQLKKARKVKRLQEENRKKHTERNKRLQEIRDLVITNLD